MPFVKKQDMGSKVGQAFGAALSAAGKAVPDAIDWMKKQEETKLRLEGLAQQKELMETSIKMQKEQAYQMGDALETQAVFAIGTAEDPEAAFKLQRNRLKRASGLNGNNSHVWGDPKAEESLMSEMVAFNKILGTDSRKLSGLTQNLLNPSFPDDKAFKAGGEALEIIEGFIRNPNVPAEYKKYLVNGKEFIQQAQKARFERSTRSSEIDKRLTGKEVADKGLDAWKSKAGVSIQEETESHGELINMGGLAEDALALADNITTLGGDLGYISGSDPMINLRRLEEDTGVADWIGEKFSGMFKKGVKDMSAEEVVENGKAALDEYITGLNQKAEKTKDLTKREKFKRLSTQFTMLQQVIAKMQVSEIMKFAAEAGVRAIDTKPEQERLFRSILSGRFDMAAFRAIAIKTKAAGEIANFLEQHKATVFLQKVKDGSLGVTQWKAYSKALIKQYDILQNDKGKTIIQRKGKKKPKGFFDLRDWAQGRVR